MAARGLTRVSELCKTFNNERIKSTFLSNALFLSRQYLTSTCRNLKVDGSRFTHKRLFTVLWKNGYSRNQLSARCYSVTEASLGAEQRSDEHEGAFENFDISKTVQENLRAKGINYLFPVQYTTFKHTIEGTDVVVQARTGTGKTLSFALPLVEKLRQDPDRMQLRGRKPRVVILAPTRELANQVHEDFAFLDRTIKVVCVYGGASYTPQVQAISGGVDVVVGTPGRMKDLIQQGMLSLEDIQHVVLDEVDQMLDMGFQDQVEEIISSCYGEGHRPQTMLYSATMPDWVRKTARRYLAKGYQHINLVGKENEQTATTVKQYSMMCRKHEQASLIQDLIKLYSAGSRVIIFCNTKAECDQLANTDFTGGSRALHGDIQQASRSVIMKAFKEQTFNILITTDVAARGLDIPDVSLVIQTEPPQDTTKYIHRVGRTGRAGKEGLSILLYGPQEKQDVVECERTANTRFETMHMPTLQQLWKACSQDAQKLLENVPAGILAQFSGEANKLIDMYGATETVAAAIAVISGAERYTNRSLITRSPGQTTLCIRTKLPLRSFNDARRKVNNYLAAEKVTVKNVEMLADKKGIVFDIPSENMESFASEFADLKDSEDETLEKLEELPNLLTFNDPHSDPHVTGGGSQSNRPRHGYTSSNGYNRHGSRNEGYRGGGFKSNRDSGWGQDRKSGLGAWDEAPDKGYGRERNLDRKFESRAQQGFQGGQRSKQRRSWNDSDDE